MPSGSDTPTKIEVQSPKIEGTLYPEHLIDLLTRKRDALSEHNVDLQEMLWDLKQENKTLEARVLDLESRQGVLVRIVADYADQLIKLQFEKEW